MRPIKASTELKECLYCGEMMEKPKTLSWPQYQKHKKFCSTSCGTKFQWKDGMPKEEKQKRSEALKGRTPWNTGNLVYKTCINCGNEFGAPGIRKKTGLYCSLNCRSEFSYKNKDEDKARYRVAVWRETFKQPLETLDNFEKRGKAKKGTDNYHIDHIIPIIEGYNNGIPPEEIGNIKNLRMLHWKKNLTRRYKRGTK